MEEELFCFPSESATYRLILLHGWGADAEDLIPLGEGLVNSLNDFDVELVSLRAPQVHPEGIGRQWYGLFPAEWEQASEAVQSLKGRLQRLGSFQLPLEKTILLGFSQGGAMAIAAGSSLPLAGIIACSAYLHPGFIPPVKTPPVLFTHGTQDSIVPMEASEKLFDLFHHNTSSSQIHLFEGGHEIPQKIYGVIRPFIEKCLCN